MKSIVILVVLVTGCGATNPALEYIKATNRNLQPIADKTEQVCNLSRSALKLVEKDTTEIEKRCDELWELLKVLRDLQEAATIIAGGEPCQNCSQSSNPQ
jgi:hypothetical protein